MIDVRTTFEYRQGHYKKSINILVTEITKDRLKNINRDNTILIYCNTGQRARRAAENMREIGYKKVYYIEGTYK